MLQPQALATPLRVCVCLQQDNRERDGHQALPTCAPNPRSIGWMYLVGTDNHSYGNFIPLTDETGQDKFSSTRPSSFD